MLQEIDKALRAVGRAGRYGAVARGLPETARDGAAWRAAGRGRDPRAPQARRRTGLRVLNEADSKELLRAYGIALAARAASPRGVDDAVRAAKDIGYPVVLKLVSAEVTHKSDIGGVILGIGSESELRAAYARLAQNLAARASAAPSSSRCWWRNRCRAASSSCSACSAIRKSGRC